jgi:hypothetical protein
MSVRIYGFWLRFETAISKWWSGTHSTATILTNHKDRVLIITQVVKEFPTFYGTRVFATMY